MRAALRRPGAARSLRETLLRLAGDGALRADVAGVEPPPSRPADRRPIDLDAHDRGTVAVHDAIRLPSGRLLLALGELGVRLVAADGRSLTRWEVPARRLVRTDHGGRALALIWRGPVVRVTVLDLATRHAGPTWEAPCDDFAASSDGDLWFVAHDNAVLALEVASGKARERWAVGEDDEQASTFSRDAGWLSFVVSQPFGVTSEIWSYQLPGLTLRRRRPTSGLAVAVAPSGARGMMIEGTSRDHRLVLLDGDREQRLDGSLVAAELDGDWIVRDDFVPPDRVLGILRLPDLEPLSHVRLRGAGSVRFQVAASVLVACDDLGRVLAVDLASGARLADLRVAP